MGRRSCRDWVVALALHDIVKVLVHVGTSRDNDESSDSVLNTTGNNLDNFDSVDCRFVACLRCLDIELLFLAAGQRLDINYWTSL